LRKAQKIRGPKAIASLLDKSARAALVKRGFAGNDILSNWPAIVGPNLSQSSSPEKLTYSRQKNAEASLKVRVAPGWALEFQHFEPLIIERINSFFGYRAVAKLQIIQAPIMRPPVAKQVPLAPLTSEQEDWIKTATGQIDDPELKKRLIAVGTSMLGSRNRDQALSVKTGKPSL
jgi:hypothetical protein